MVRHLKYKGSIIPYIHGRYVLRRVMMPEKLCTFEEKTGYIDFGRYDDHTEVTFVREKDNPVDKFAVKVLADGRFVGYLYRSSQLRAFLLGIGRHEGVRYMARFDDVRSRYGIMITVAFYVRFDGREYEKVGTWSLDASRNCDIKARKLEGRLFALKDLPEEEVSEVLDEYDEMYGHVPQGPDTVLIPLPFSISTFDGKTIIGRLPVESCMTFISPSTCRDFLAQISVSRKNGRKGKRGIMVSVYRVGAGKPVLHQLT